MKLANKITLIFIFLFSTLATSTFAAETTNLHKKIKIGFYYSQGIFEKNAQGNYQGFGVDYINTLAKIGNFEYVFVDDSWSALLEKLKNKEIDLLFPSYKNPTRKKLFEFSNHYIGLEQGVLLTRKDNQNLFYKDYKNLNHLKIGLIKDNFIAHYLNLYQKKHNLSFKPKYYNSEAQIIDALNNKEIDLIAAESILIYRDVKIVDVFPTKPFYFMGQKQSLYLPIIDNAINKLHQEDLNAEVNLYKMWMDKNPVSKDLRLTRAEMRYIQNNPQINVGFINNKAPFNHKQDQQIQGLSVNILNSLATRVNLKLHFIAYSDIPTLNKALQKGNISLGLSILNSQDTNNLSLSKNIADGEYKLFTHSDYIINNKSKKSIAIPTLYNNPDFIKTIKSKFPMFNVKSCELDTCLKQVISGNLDAILLDEFSATYLQQRPIYNELKAISHQYIPLSIHFLLQSNHSEQTINNILNKALKTVNKKDIENIILESTLNKDNSHAFDDFLHKYFTIIVLSSILLITLVLLVFLLQKNKNQKLNYKLIETADKLSNNLRFDSVTNLLRYSALKTNIYRYISTTSKKDQFALICLDIKNFSFINKYYGHKAGDLILSEVANRLSQIFEQNFLSRYGCDEFLIFIPVLNTTKDIEKIVAKINKAFAKVFAIKNANINLNCKMGIRIFSNHLELDLDKKFNQTVMVLEEIKDQSDVNYNIFNDEMLAEIEYEAKIIELLSNAIKNQELKVFYQPQVNLQSKKIIGVEALVRWFNPELGLIMPNHFISLAEKNNLIIQLDNYILKTACREILYISPNGKNALRLSMNISPIQLLQPNFVPDLVNIVKESEIDINRITLEITEGVMIHNLSSCSTILNELRTYGFAISIDDFGTGYSSLSYLSSLPINEIKIDRCFINKLMTSNHDRDLIKSVIAISKNKGSIVVAEGVESEEQSNWLELQGCDVIQGYYYAKPLDIVDLSIYFKKNFYRITK